MIQSTRTECDGFRAEPQAGQSASLEVRVSIILAKLSLPVAKRESVVCGNRTEFLPTLWRLARTENRCHRSKASNAGCRASRSAIK